MAVLSDPFTKIGAPIYGVFLLIISFLLFLDFTGVLLFVYFYLFHLGGLSRLGL